MNPFVKAARKIRAIRSFLQKIIPNNYMGYTRMSLILVLLAIATPPLYTFLNGLPYGGFHVVLSYSLCILILIGGAPLHRLLHRPKGD